MANISVNNKIDPISSQHVRKFCIISNWFLGIINMDLVFFSHSKKINPSKQQSECLGYQFEDVFYDLLALLPLAP
jgi:hypothetical protein